MNIRLAQLILSGSRRSGGRSIGIIGGIALGTVLILLIVGAINGLQQRDQRFAWFTTDVTQSSTSDDTSQTAIQLSNDQILYATKNDAYKNDTIMVATVASRADSTVSIPGVAKAPLQGEYYLSPALESLVDSAPDNQLRDRFGTKQRGTIDESDLTSPNSLVAIVGVDQQTFGPFTKANVVTSFSKQGLPLTLLSQIVLGIGAIGLIFPVILLVSITTQLGEATRRDRFATLSLLGATKRQIARIVVLENVGLTLIGIIVGYLLSLLLMPLVAMISISGGSFFPSDLRLSLSGVIAIACGLLLLTSIAAYFRVVRSNPSPLGASKQVIETKPRLWRVLPILLGFVLFWVSGNSLSHATEQNTSLALGFLSGFILIIIGLLLAGPWLTCILARLWTRSSRKTASLIASRRITSSPKAIFRSVSGLVVTIFLVSTFFGILSVIRTADLAQQPGQLDKNGLLITSVQAVPSALPQLATSLGKLEGVTSTVLVYGTQDPGLLSHSEGENPGIIRCDQTKRLQLPACPDGATYGAFDQNKFLYSQDEGVTSVRAVDSSLQQQLIPDTLIVTTDGTGASTELVRTTVATTAERSLRVQTRQQAVGTGESDYINDLVNLAYIGIAVSIIIAGTSLTVSTIIAMIDRKRIFGLLRLMGTPVTVIRQTVLYEAALPLIATVVSSALFGFLTASIVISTLSQSRHLQAPGWLYFATVGISLLLILIVLGFASRTVKSSTEISSTRFE